MSKQQNYNAYKRNTVEWIQVSILVQSQYATASDFTECE